MRTEYRFLRPKLVESGYRVIQMDLRGVGEGSVDWDDYSLVGVGKDILSLIQDLGAGPAALIGTSLAAGAGIWAAVEDPPLVSAMILIGPAVHGETMGFNRLLYRLLFRGFWGVGVWIQYYSSLYTTRKPGDFPQYIASLKTNLRERGRMQTVIQMMLASKSASEERMPRVTCPVRVIMGSKDPDFKDSEVEARWVAERLQADYQIVQDAGHYPHAEMPEDTATLVIDFLKEHHR